MVLHRMTAMRAAAQYWLWVLPTTAVGVWIAASLVPGYRVDGRPGQQLLAVLVVAVLVAVVIKYLPVPAYRVLGRTEARAVRRFSDEAFNAFNSGFDSAFDSAWKSIRRIWLLILVRLAIELVVLAMVAPAALWLATWLGAALGLPVSLSGLWPTVVAGLVICAVRRLVAEPVGWLTGRGRGRRTARGLFGYLLPLGGLGLAVVVLGGVRLEPAPGARQVLTMAVLAALFVLVRFILMVPFVTTVARVVGNALKLWVVSWLSGWMDVTLQIEGFWTLALAALIVTAVNWPVWFADKPRQPMPDPFWADPFPHHHYPIY